MAGGHQRLKFKEDVEKLRLGEMIGDELILIARGRRRITRLVTSSSGTSGCCPTRPRLAVWKPWPMVREGGEGEEEDTDAAGDFLAIPGTITIREVFN
jgi:hypothetical protein